MNRCHCGHQRYDHPRDEPCSKCGGECWRFKWGLPIVLEYNPPALAAFGNRFAYEIGQQARQLSFYDSMEPHIAQMMREVARNVEVNKAKYARNAR